MTTNMKKKVYFAVVLLASLVMGACSSDDGDGDKKEPLYTETTVSEAPQWQVDWSNNQPQPDWKEPDGSAYEDWTTLLVKLEDTLQPFSSQDDMMVLLVNGEIRAKAAPALIESGSLLGSTYFLMKAYYNNSESGMVNLTLRYYCKKLQHIFTLSAEINLDTDVTTGIDEDFVPEFTSGAEKYTLTKVADVESIVELVGITPATSGVVAAFVGDECRGVTEISSWGDTELLIYGRSSGESVTLKYYDAAKGKLYTIPKAVKM